MEKNNHRISSGMILLFAAASGLAVGNLYWAQPLLSAIAKSFAIPASQGGFFITATQIGYALGILLIVPLGDVLERRKLLSIVMLATIFALFFCGMAPYFALLAAAFLFLGFSTVSGQIILPLAGDLASEKDRGRVVGLITSGITTGILFSRLVSGLIADIWGWRSIYFLAAILNLVMICAMRSMLPKMPVKEKVTYTALLLGVFSSVKRYPQMRGILLKQGLIFGITFNIFWTALTFLLAGEPFFFGTTQIGLFSLAGLTGTIAGAKLGTLQDRGLGNRSITVFMLMSIITMGLGALSGSSLILIVLIAALFSLAVQGVGILTQAQLFSLSDAERSRLNTAFVVSNFLFCSIGSSLATFLWDLGGWPAISLGAASASLLALLVHLFFGVKQSQKSVM